MLEGNDRLASDFERLGHPDDEKEKCLECQGDGCSIVPWSDAEEASPWLKSLVLEYPVYPDGTVLIKCTHCDAYESRGV